MSITKFIQIGAVSHHTMKGFWAPLSRVTELFTPAPPLSLFCLFASFTSPLRDGHSIFHFPHSPNKSPALILLYIVGEFSGIHCQGPLKGVLCLFLYEALLVFGLAMLGFHPLTTSILFVSVCSFTFTFVNIASSHLLQHGSQRERPAASCQHMTWLFSLTASTDLTLKKVCSDHLSTNLIPNFRAQVFSWCSPLPCITIHVGTCALVWLLQTLASMWTSPFLLSPLSQQTGRSIAYILGCCISHGSENGQNWETWFPNFHNMVTTTAANKWSPYTLYLNLLCYTSKVLYL